MLKLVMKKVKTIIFIDKMETNTKIAYTQVI